MTWNQGPASSIKGIIHQCVCVYACAPGSPPTLRLWSVSIFSWRQLKTGHPWGAVEADEAHEQGSQVSAGSNIKEGFLASRADSEQVTAI